MSEESAKSNGSVRSAEKEKAQIDNLAEEVQKTLTILFDKFDKAVQRRIYEKAVATMLNHLVKTEAFEERMLRDSNARIQFIPLEHIAFSGMIPFRYAKAPWSEKFQSMIKWIGSKAEEDLSSQGFKFSLGGEPSIYLLIMAGENYSLRAIHSHIGMREIPSPPEELIAICQGIYTLGFTARIFESTQDKRHYSVEAFKLLATEDIISSTVAYLIIQLAFEPQDPVQSLP